MLVDGGRSRLVPEFHHSQVLLTFKIQCDQQKPQCAICLMRSTQCPGYDRDSGVFIHHKRNNCDRNCDRNLNPQNLQVQTRPLGRPATRDQIFACYYTIYFPSSQCVSKVNPWQFLITSFQSLSQKSQMLDRAVFAISSLYIGKMKDDFRLFNYGQLMYNEAIQLLRNKICRGSYDKEIVYTTLIFQEIEVTKE